MKKRIKILTLLVLLFTILIITSNLCFKPFSISINLSEVGDKKISDVIHENYYHDFRWFGKTLLGKNFLFLNAGHNDIENYSATCLYAGYHNYYCLISNSESKIIDYHITKSRCNINYNKYVGYTVEQLKSELGQPALDCFYGNKREIIYLKEGLFLLDCSIYIFHIDDNIVSSAKTEVIGV